MSKEQRLFTLEDMFKIKGINTAKLSPDGKYAAYCVTENNEEKNLSFTNIFLIDLESGKEKQLTFGESKNNSINWAPNSKSIAFISVRDEKPQIYQLSILGGEAKQLTSLEQSIGAGPVYSPDGKWIAFTAGKDKPKRDPSKPYRIDRSIYRFDAIGYLDDAIQDIFVVPVEGGEVKQLTDDRFNNGVPVWSPDSKKLAFIPMADPNSISAHGHNVDIVDFDGNRETFLDNWGYLQGIFWPREGELAVFGHPYGLPIGSKDDLWLLSLKDGKLVCRTEKMENGIGGSIRNEMGMGWASIVGFSADNQTAWVTVQEGGQVNIYKVALNGKEKTEKIVSGDHSNYLLDVKEDQLLYVRTDFDNPCDLFINTFDGKNEKRLTEINADLLAELQIPETERLLFKGVDGEEIEGWIIKPLNVEAPYPTVLSIHGGPHFALGYGHSFDAWYLAANGLATLYINHRASTGYGQKFATMIKGDWGNLDYKDLMSGVDYAIEQGLVDGDRMGCTGVSGGGNLSCWIVGNTDRFKAAMPENPVTNWNSFYGTSDVGVWFSVEELGGHPHEIPEIYTKCSPITYAHNCKTPTLMVQSEMDFRCPAEQSEQFYTTLKANGCVVEMLRFPNSSHGGLVVGPLPVRRAHREALLDWMKKYLLGESSNTN